MLYKVSIFLTFC